jgi:hypothetical protein
MVEKYFIGIDGGAPAIQSITHQLLKILGKYVHIF